MRPVAAAIAAVLLADIVALATLTSGSPSKTVGPRRIGAPATLPATTAEARPSAPAPTAPPTTVRPPPVQLVFTRTDDPVDPRYGTAIGPRSFAVRLDGSGLHQLPSVPKTGFAQVDSATGEVVYAKQLSAVSGPQHTGCGFAGCSVYSFSEVQEGIAVSSPDGSRERVLTAGGYDSEPSFSPDGRSIAFRRHLKLADGTITDAVAIIDLQGDVIGGRLPPRGSEYDAPVWSPDGASLAVRVAGSGPQGNTYSVWILPADGAAGRKVADGSFQGLAFSHDGRHVAAENIPLSGVPTGVPGGSDLWVLSVSGGPPRRLTHLAPPQALSLVYCGLSGGVSVDTATPMWSPDDRQIIFLSDYRHLAEVDADDDIERIDADGSHLRTLWASPRHVCGQSPVRVRLTLVGWLPSPAATRLGLA